MTNIDTYNSFKTSLWAGGTTTELFIWPIDSDFKTGNFQFRLSTATVEIEESVFTKLPGVDRTLVLLDGKMILEHTGHHQKNLAPFDIDHFSGSWETKSKGRCTDFNLMTKGGIEGKVSIIDLKSYIEEHIVLDVGQHFFYNYHEPITITHSGVFQIASKSLTRISTKSKASQITIVSKAACSLVCVQI
ncbi:MAG: HutD family protein [Fulvivirga sp.]|uniref:HutD/Ves family protein n=1 Tax=Fulvivirga sp. TaxID=1931237 RepID=UPI0032EF6554